MAPFLQIPFGFVRQGCYRGCIDPVFVMPPVSKRVSAFKKADLNITAELEIMK